MIYIVYWRNKKNRITHHGYVMAKNQNDAYDITLANLQEGNEVTAVYTAKEHQITPQSITINFPNPASYSHFG